VREVLRITCSSNQTDNLLADSYARTSKPRCAKAASPMKNPALLLKFYEEGLHGYTYLEDVHEQ
jgi:hypothetical protein